MKKRYSLTLETEVMEELQELAKSMGMPRSIISQICDDSIRGTLGLLKAARAKGKLTITDMFTYLGEQVEEQNSILVEQQGGIRGKKQKRTADVAS